MNKNIHIVFLIFILTTPVYASDYIDALGVERAQDWSVSYGMLRYDGEYGFMSKYDYITGKKIRINSSSINGWSNKASYRFGAKAGLEKKCKNKWKSFGLNVLPDNYISTPSSNFSAVDVSHLYTPLSIDEFDAEKRAGNLRSALDLSVAEYRAKCKPFSLEENSKIKWLLDW